VSVEVRVRFQACQRVPSTHSPCSCWGPWSGTRRLFRIVYTTMAWLLGGCHIAVPTSPFNPTFTSNRSTEPRFQPQTLYIPRWVVSCFPIVYRSWNTSASFIHHRRFLLMLLPSFVFHCIFRSGLDHVFQLRQTRA
jgi:hypothetical protein